MLKSAVQNQDGIILAGSKVFCLLPARKSTTSMDCGPRDTTASTSPLRRLRLIKRQRRIHSLKLAAGAPSVLDCSGYFRLRDGFRATLRDNTRSGDKRKPTSIAPGINASWNMSSSPGTLEVFTHGIVWGHICTYTNCRILIG
jgi:hypothetical protein